MASWDTPHAAVLFGSLIKGDPDSTDAKWIGNQETAVLMHINFSADLWIFEDVHGLNNLGSFEEEDLATDFLHHS